MITVHSRVILEPELQEEVGNMRPGDRRRLARKLYRWAKQLWVSAAIMELDEAPKPKPRLKKLPAEKLRLN